MNSVMEYLGTPTLSPYASFDFNQSFWCELKSLASDVASIVGDDLLAVVLGGGFGRGEGCITRVDGYEVPYNDVDLFLITRTQFPKGLGQLKRLSERYEHRLQIAVDFSRPQTPAMIAKWEPLLMWQELVNRHLILHGSADTLSRHVESGVLQKLPVVEASRLLLNRGAGLLWAGRVTQGLDVSPDASFVIRNYFKCCQALGDASLIAVGEYCSEASQKLSRLEFSSQRFALLRQLQIPETFSRSIAFRANPSGDYGICLSDIRSLAEQWSKLFLWIEANRLGAQFHDIADYLQWKGTHEPVRGDRIRLIAANLRRGRIGWQHPRECVYRCLPFSVMHLLSGDTKFAQSSEVALCHWRGAA